MLITWTPPTVNNVQKKKNVECRKKRDPQSTATNTDESNSVFSLFIYSNLPQNNKFTKW